MVGEWESKEKFSLFKSLTKKRKKYSPSTDFIAPTVSTRDRFQKFSRLKIQWNFKSESLPINRASTIFIKQSWEESFKSRKNLRVQRKFFSCNFLLSVCCIHQPESSLCCQPTYNHQLSVIKVYFQ